MFAKYQKPLKFNVQNMISLTVHFMTSESAPKTYPYLSFCVRPKYYYKCNATGTFSIHITQICYDKKQNKTKTIQAQPSLPIIPGSGSVKSLFIVMTFTSFPLNRDWVENN